MSSKMDKIKVKYQLKNEDWKPSPVTALATSIDGTRVAASREDGSLELWLVSANTIGWHCQLTIHGDPNRIVSSLIWCPGGEFPHGRLFSSNIDGSVSFWDLQQLKQTMVLESTGVSIWKMAVTLAKSDDVETNGHHIGNGYLKKFHGSDENENSESDEDSDSPDVLKQSSSVKPRVAVAFDDGCVKIYTISDANEFIYLKSLNRVKGRVLSVTWSTDAKFICSGSSDGIIRIWDAKSGIEAHNMSAGLGRDSGHELCIWSLLYLRSGILVSGDSSGSVQFWDCREGASSQQPITKHKGDVHALAVAPDHNMLFSAGADGQVVLYKLSESTIEKEKWIYVDYKVANKLDSRALTVAVPISQQDALPGERIKRARREEKPKPDDSNYHKWAHSGHPMLISAGDDTKLYAYPVKEFTNFKAHCICPVPQRTPIQVALNTSFNQSPMLLLQSSHWIEVRLLHLRNVRRTGDYAKSETVGRFKIKASRRIICSTLANSGEFFAFSDNEKPTLYKVERSEAGKITWSFSKRKLPERLPFAHSMIFSHDSSLLIVAGYDRRIYVVDVNSSELVHTFTPFRELQDDGLSPAEPPITKLFTSSDKQWLAAVNCFGDIYVFNLDLLRQHWFISRLDGASVTACGFSPQINNVLIVTTSSNRVYEFDVDAKKWGDWSVRNTFVLPRRFHEFPGEVIGLSFPPSSTSSSVMVYSSRAMCLIDFCLPVKQDEGEMFHTRESDESEMFRTRESVVKNSPNLNVKKRTKFRKNIEVLPKSFENFEVLPFEKDRVLYLSHISNNRFFMIEKPWSDVVSSLDVLPVHRHIYGA